MARIEQIERGDQLNRVVIVRTSGARRAAHPYDYLYAGDRLLLTGQSTRVWIRRARGTGLEKLSAEQNAVVVFDRTGAPSLSGRLRSLAARLNYWWNVGRRRIPTQAVARSLDVNSLRAPQPEPMPLRAILSSRQSIAPDRTLIVPVWAGDAVRLRVADSQGTELLSSLVIGKYATRVRLSESVRGATLTLIGTGDLSASIEVERADPMTALPPWIGGIEDPHERELAAAAWLAIEGPAEWRLEGYSRLTELAERDLAAQSVWEAVTGEWVIGRD